MAYNVELKDGELLTGVIQTDTPSKSCWRTRAEIPSPFRA